MNFEKDENVQHPVIISCGGEPIRDCPKNWDQAELFLQKANEGKGDSEPKWSFDCGFKLDFDGPLISVESRFYPPKTHYGPAWDGTLTITTAGIKTEKLFHCETFEDLKNEVETFVYTVIRDVSEFIRQKNY